MITAAANTANPLAAEALERLCVTYWPPVYSYLRRKNFSPEDAHDMAQDFFCDFIQKDLPGCADPDRGRFRSYLLGILRNSLSHRHERTARQKRGGGQTEISLDALNDDGTPVLELVDAATPEAAYEQRWAMTVLESAFVRLRQASTSDPKSPLFSSLAPYIWGDKGSKTSAEIGQELAMPEGTVRVALHRLRQNYRGAVRAVIRETVIDPREVDTELAHLMSILGTP